MVRVRTAADCKLGRVEINLQPDLPGHCGDTSVRHTRYIFRLPMDHDAQKIVLVKLNHG